MLSKIDHPPAQGYGNDDYNRRPRSVRKDRDDKVHDSIIEERIQRERPCRTLFIRNIKASDWGLKPRGESAELICGGLVRDEQ
jgi:hypothetical protein